MWKFPASCSREELQPDCKLLAFHRHAIHHPRTRSEISQQRSHIQSIVGFPRFVGEDACPARAHVLRDPFLRGRAEIEARQIDGDLHRQPIFGSFGNIHRSPLARKSGPGPAENLRKASAGPTTPESYLRRTPNGQDFAASLTSRPVLSNGRVRLSPVGSSAGNSQRRSDVKRAADLDLMNRASGDAVLPEGSELHDVGFSCAPCIDHNLSGMRAFRILVDLTRSFQVLEH